MLFTHAEDRYKNKTVSYKTTLPFYSLQKYCLLASSNRSAENKSHQLLLPLLCFCLSRSGKLAEIDISIFFLRRFDGDGGRFRIAYINKYMRDCYEIGIYFAF